MRDVIAGLGLGQIPVIFGILNLTPDSFSDGGLYQSIDSAVSAGLDMVRDGASIIDVGGESTRPGSRRVSAAEELNRVLEVVERLASEGVEVSVDTSKADVARACLEVGAAMINDVTAMRDPEMAEVCAKADCSVCLMHMQGTPATMQLAPTYGDVVAEVGEFLLERASFAVESGVRQEKIWIDPGIGFGKTDDHNLLLIREIGALVETGYPVLLGVSRKGFLGRMLAKDGEPASVNKRMVAGLAVQSYAQLQGVCGFRTHDVRPTAELARTLSSFVRER